MSDWSGWATDTLFSNNIFYTEGTGRYGHAVGRNADGTYGLGAGLESARGTVFDHNLYFGVQIDRPEDLHFLTQDPLLVSAGSGGLGIGSLSGYQLLPGSRAIDSGVWIEGNGGRDLFGVVVPGKRAVDRGASEFETSRQSVRERQKSAREQVRKPLNPPVQ